MRKTGSGLSLVNRIVLAAVLLTVLPRAGQAGEAYYLLMFGSQRVPNDPDYSHTFATFVRATWPGDGPCPESSTLEAHTISWLPRTVVVRTCALRAECGHNFGLEETLRIAQDGNERVSLWGPFQIEPELYHLALKQIALLESGQVLYKANDFGHRSDSVSNCIHAVSTVVVGPRLHIASPGWGQTASFAVLRRFLPWVMDPDRVHSWVGSALGLDSYPIFYRNRQPPRSGGILGPIYRLLGGEGNL